MESKVLYHLAFHTDLPVGYFIIYRPGDHLIGKLKQVPEANKTVSVIYVN
jgi:hypothetical protein